MTLIIGYLLGLLTFPGVIVHEFAHKKSCDVVGVPVIETVYFRLGNPPGYVRHLEPARYRESFAISVAPFLVNSVVAFGLFLAFAFYRETIWVPETSSTAVTLGAIGLFWLGISIGMHAFPSTGDANTLWARSRAEWREAPVVLVGIPVVVVIYVANLLSRLYADVLYALVLAVGAIAVVGSVL